ncbi:MAG: sulfite reductase subunit alpha [Verrucomicrobiota bacterium]
MTTSAATPEAPLYNKNNPFLAKVTDKGLLCKEESEKETRHIVINIEGSGLSYIPGQSIAVFPTNTPQLVTDLLEVTGFSPQSTVTLKDGTTKPLIDHLTKDLSFNRVTAKFVKAVAEKLPEGEKKTELSTIIEEKEKLDAFVFTRDYVDVLKEYPEAKFTLEEFIALPGKIVPRLYSIASSIEKHPNEVHLTVAIVRYNTHDRDKTGLATGYLADVAPLDENVVPIFFAPAKHFLLPEDPNTPIIMVGPGTGIAPFRAFLEQREIDKAPGKSWLFFGEQRRATDFLYEEDFNQWLESGTLTRLDTAFSRDQEHKIYVQDRIRENGAEIWEWLQNGAIFYICGDAKRMAKDVNQALIDIAAEHGGMSPEDAETYINKTLAREEKRYLKDVY